MEDFEIADILDALPDGVFHMMGIEKEVVIEQTIAILPALVASLDECLPELLEMLGSESAEGEEEPEADCEPQFSEELAEAFAPFVFMLVDHATANKVDFSFLDMIFGQEIVSHVKNAQRLVRWACIATNPNVHESSDSILRGIAQIEDTLVVLCFLKGTYKEAESLTAALESALPELEALYDEFLDQELALSEEGIYQCILEHESCARAKHFELFELNVPYIPKPPPSITLHRFRASA